MSAIDLYEIEGARGETLRPVERLTLLMSEWSEECYCAGWLIDCEHVLWGMVAHGEARFWGIDRVPEDAVAKMRALSDEIGGWVAWRDGEAPGFGGLEFVPMVEWLAEHAAWRERP